MILKLIVMLFVVVLLVGCSAPPPEPQATQPQDPELAQPRILYPTPGIDMPPPGTTVEEWERMRDDPIYQPKPGAVLEVPPPPDGLEKIKEDPRKRTPADTTKRSR